MNKHNAARYLPLVAALAEGRTIQANRGSPGEPQWENLEANEGEVHFTCVPELYRIAPDGRS